MRTIVCLALIGTFGVSTQTVIARDIGSPTVPTSGDAAAAPVEEIKQAEPMICRKPVGTGSRLRVKKICMTAAQWELTRRNAAQEASRTINRGGGQDPRVQ